VLEITRRSCAAFVSGLKYLVVSKTEAFVTSQINPEFETFYALTGSRATNKLKAGTVLFQQGDAGERMYALVSGQVEMSLNGRSVEVITPGTCFGVEALVSPEHRRFTTATALTDIEILDLDREEFLFALQELPMFGLEVLWDAELRIRGLQSASHPAA
jgi:CRP/FNR family cyclic AMP-dependent transcriptional regulator